MPKKRLKPFDVIKTHVVIVAIVTSFFVVLPVIIRHLSGVGATFSISVPISSAYVWTVILATLCTTIVLAYGLKNKSPFFSAMFVIFVSLSSTYISHVFGYPKLIYLIPLVATVFVLRKQLDFLFPLMSFFGADFLIIAIINLIYKNERNVLHYLVAIILSLVGYATKFWLYQPSYSFGIFETGYLLGTNILLLIFGIIGFFISWKKRTKRAQLLSLVVLIISPITPLLQISSVIILAYYSAFTFEKLLKQDWEENAIKILTVISLCGLVLASYVFLSTQIVQAQPNEDFFGALNYTQSHYGDVVILTSQESANVLQKIKISAVVIEENEILERTIEPALLSFRSKNASLFWVDESILGQVQNQPLSLHLNNENIFREVYKNEEVTIFWINYGQINTIPQTES